MVLMLHLHSRKGRPLGIEYMLRFQLCLAVFPSVRLRGSVSSNLIIAQKGTEHLQWYNWKGTDGVVRLGFYLPYPSSLDAGNNLYSPDEYVGNTSECYMLNSDINLGQTAAAYRYKSRPNNITIKIWLRIA